MEIAVIGMAGRFPGAEDIQTFWDNLLAGHESISFFSDEELLDAGVDPALLAKPNYVKAKGVFPGIDSFDADFFHYTPRDAATLDPQVRALHEEVYHALEDAGYAAEERRGATGLFVGSTNNFSWELATMQASIENGGHPFAAIQLNDKDFAATRIAYSLNLQGPCVAVSSACSTSLYAVDLACRQLLTGACSLAIAGGSGLSLPGASGYLYEEGSIRSPDGHCRPFDADAQGTVEGNGAGVVVLKRMDEAIRDRDRIYAIIRGTAANNDGRRKVGYTAPSIEGQAEVIRRALRMADVAAESVVYVETHGTGTKLGDPVELAGLKQAFRSASPGSCGIGSLKSNIGHLDAAAGVASLIKTALALKHGTLPASLHYERSNPELGLEDSPFRVIRANEPLLRKPAIGDSEARLPLRAGVSSFGIGGTNVHLVLEEAPEQAASGPGRAWKLLCLSAHTDAALARRKADLLDFLTAGHSRPDPSDLAWSLQTGQKRMSRRYAIAYRELDDLAAGLSASIAGAEGTTGHDAAAPEGEADVYFMFPGQGSQYPGMARELYRTEAVFGAALDACLQTAAVEGLTELRRLLIDPAEGDEQRMQETELAQPALFAVEYALGRLLMSWGIKPAGMIGHSLGEYTAACLAGVLTAEDAMRLVIARGRLMQAMPRGAMVGISAAAEQIEPLLGEGLSMAAVNSVAQCTAAGTEEAVQALEAQLDLLGISWRRLRTSHAFHSSLMEGAQETLVMAAAGLQRREPVIPYMSNLTGQWITAVEATDPSYYGQHLRSKVRFAEGLTLLLDNERAVLIEVGPGQALCGFAMQSAARQPLGIIPLLSRADRSGDTAGLTERLGLLWCRGVEPDWQAYYAGQLRSRVSLPLYPFEKTTFPSDQRLQLPIQAGSEVAAAAERLPVYAPRVAAPAVGRLMWEQAFLPLAGRLDRPRCCLVFTDREEGLGRIMGRLSRWRRLPVRFEEHYRYEGTLGAAVRPGHPLDLRQLLRDLREQALLPDTIVVAFDDRGTTAEVLMDSFHAAAAELKEQMPELIALVTIPTTEPIYGLLSLVQGLRAVGGTHHVSLLDAGVPLTHRDAPERWADMLRHELAGSGYRPPAAAYREGRRLVPRFSRMDMPEAAASRLTAAEIVLLGSEAQLDGAKRLAMQLERQWDARVRMMPYRLTETALDDSTIREMKARLDAVQAQFQREADFSEAARDLMDEYATCLAYDYVNRHFPLLPGHWFMRREMVEGLGVITPLERYVDYFLHLFELGGIVRYDGEDSGYYVLESRWSTLSRPEARRAVERLTPLLTGQLDLLEHCVAGFDAALRGDIPSLGVLYPDGHNDLLLRTHQGSLHEREDDFALEMLAELIASLAAGQRKLRILEAGGGYGAILRKAAPLLQGLEIEYYFTDVSKSFLAQFEQYAVEAELDFLRLGLFDITKAPREQGLEEASFDCVVAYNVVHATRRLDVSLGQLGKLLKPGGLLGIAERTRVRAYVDLIWGLADGWWHFDDTERSLSPLISMAQWERQLAAAGLEDIVSYPGASDLREQLDIGLILGRRPELDAPRIASLLDDGREILPVLTAETPAELERVARTVLMDMKADAVVVWDEVSTGARGFESLAPSTELDIQAAEAIQTAAGAAAAEQAKPALLVSAIAAGTQWGYSQTQWAQMHERVDTALPTHRIYAAIDRSALPEEMPAVLDAMVSAGMRRLAVRPEDHPFLSIVAPPPSPRAEQAEADGREELETLLRQLWGKLLGREQVGLDADFFELGGDSFKLIQMTVDLERYGHKVLMNEVYHYPTIRSLARHIHDKTGSYDQGVATFAELEQRLSGSLRTTVRIRLTSGEQPLTVLFADDASIPGGLEQIRELLREWRIRQELLPDLIAPLLLADSLPDVLSVDHLVQAGVLGASQQVDESRMRRLLDERSAFEAAVLGQPVVKRYGISNIQKMHFRGDVRLQLYYIEFNEIIDARMLEQAFCDLVGSHGLMRSCLKKQLGVYRWQEHAAPQRTPLPMLDISHLAPDSQARVMARLAREEWDADFKKTDKLMYHVQLIKWNERKYQLFFQFDHSIFDASSGQAMRRQLLQRYKDLLGGARHAMELSTSYGEYLDQICRGPSGIDADRLIELFDLKRYGQAATTVLERLKPMEKGRIKQIRFNLDISDYAFERNDPDGPFHVGMALCILVISRLLNVDVVPFDLLFQNRRYEGKNFSDVVGLVLDGVPFVVPVNREQPAEMIEIMKEKIRYMNEHNVNFLNLVWNAPTWLRWHKVGKAKKGSASTFYSPLLLNYAGNAEEEYEKIWDYSLAQLDDDDQSKFNYGDFYGLFKVINNTLEFLILCKFESDMERIQKLFYEEMAYLTAGQAREAAGRASGRS